VSSGIVNGYEVVGKYDVYWLSFVLPELLSLVVSETKLVGPLDDVGKP
jgi:hypothetical protein